MEIYKSLFWSEKITRYYIDKQIKYAQIISYGNSSQQVTSHKIIKTIMFIFSHEASKFTEPYNFSLFQLKKKSIKKFYFAFSFSPQLPPKQSKNSLLKNSVNIMSF